MTGNEYAAAVCTLLKRAFAGRMQVRAAFEQTAYRQTADGMLAVVRLHSENRTAGGTDIEIGVDVYLSPAADLSQAADLMEELCGAVSEAFAENAAVSRTAAVQDGATGALRLPCILRFAQAAGGGVPVTIDGETRTAAAVRVSVRRDAVPVTAIGESVPFAYQRRGVLYTVELQGFDASDLAALDRFRAEIGGIEPAVYVNCSWTGFDENHAVFVAAEREAGHG